MLLSVSDNEKYKELLETWCPEKGKPPSAFYLDTSEETILLPDFLKLIMLRSSIDAVINAGKYCHKYDRREQAIRHLSFRA